MDKKEIIRSANEALYEQGDLGAIEHYFSDKYIAHSGDRSHQGHEFIKRFISQIRTSLSDLKVMKIHFLMEDGNGITWQRTLEGIHKNNLMGIPASQKKVRWSEMVVSRFEDGKICEEWLVSELAGELMLKLPQKSI